MFHTKFGENRSRPSFFRRIWIKFFLMVISNFKISMYPWSFLCEEAKTKQHTSSKKELCEIGEEAIWESRFTCFLMIWHCDEMSVYPLWQSPQDRQSSRLLVAFTRSLISIRKRSMHPTPSVNDSKRTNNISFTATISTDPRQILTAIDTQNIEEFRCYNFLK